MRIKIKKNKDNSCSVFGEVQGRFKKKVCAFSFSDKTMKECFAGDTPEQRFENMRGVMAVMDDLVMNLYRETWSGYIGDKITWIKFYIQKFLKSIKI